MNDFQTISNIVNESIKNSSYYTVAISSCVFILYTLIIQLVGYFKGKAKNKPIIIMSDTMKEMAANIVRLNTILDKTFKEVERKETHKCKTVINLGFKAFAARISQECESIIIHNNIVQNKVFITENITKLVSTEYFKLYSILSSYEINEVNVATKLKEEWIKEVADSVISIIYDGQDSISRITQLNNRLMICVGDYSTYINNKTFNT